MEIVIEEITGVDTATLEEMKSSFRKWINGDFKEFIEDLNLSILDKIIIPNDFGEAVTKFQKEHNLQVGYTSNEMGVAGGKNLPFERDGETRVVIFIQSGVFLSIFNKEFAQGAVNIIHHELCHVHDQYNNLQMEKFNEGYYKDTGDLLFDLLKKHSSCVWDEYIAPRLSCSTLPKDSDLSYLFLLDLIKDTENKVKKDIEDYRTQGDISLLFKNIQELTSLTLKIAATVIGNLHGLNYNDTEVSEVINKGLEGTFIFPIWNELHETLENLYQSYPNWKDIYVFDSLNNLILKSWNELGVFPENRGQGLYVNVP
ncbi:hypothetical protein FA002_02210 [Priestia megaterium]|uniref:hypothetical protein n=2 Tax=Priestia megaterium TaxID=1404 RepID=UPI0010AC6329|nr:hypothetical protein [Priestia megaterium]TJZ40405.1 hypothetical protein FA002_02210 [Priestia megaterium]